MSLAISNETSTLRETHIRSLEKLLNLNQNVDELEKDPNYKSEFPIWKVLIFDKSGSDTISSVMRITELRKHGVTVHMNITSSRQPIADVPAIYFVQPTEENVEYIIDDLSKGLYESAYVCFSSSIPRSLLEKFAELASKTNTSHMINQVYDQYLNYVVLESDFFSLQLPGVFHTIHSPSSDDALIENTIQSTVNRLFSVIVTLGTIPIIRCPQGSAAELVARKLNQRLKDHLMNTKDVFGTLNPKIRPLLILLDRTVDLVPMINHSWTYQALIHDTLNMHLNRVILESVDEGKVSKQSYDLNGSDYFWEANANKPFPEVAENIDEELTRYKNDANEITRRSGASSLEEFNADAFTDSTYLKAAVSLLPELTARKQLLDMHMSIATTILKAIKERHLDDFFQMEDNVTGLNKSAILSCLEDKDKGTPDDKLRFFIIWYLSVDTVPGADLQAYEEALVNNGCSLEALNFVKRVREITKMTMLASSTTRPMANQPGDNIFGGFSSLSSKFTDRFKEAGIGGLENIISGVKNLIPFRKDGTITSIVQSLMDPGSSSVSKQTESYLVFDPKASHASSDPRGMNKRQIFNEAIVCVLGGGNYLEYGNLMDWAKEQNPPKHITYGSTDVQSPSQFMNEMASLS
ncbi:SNARE binding protein Sly1 [Schizosaccharomyces osmophilus]|uniref:SNARE binding protein Sly1 n=1 Tax=Schizosaccharomyces osmophilus TaxID=2545709 RepID=A0AAE9WEW1_9SCHI|nr:SNARE binding protein Sly1 [Schizosaccharomyces osmophilus]WBW75000.1 SNARE binding protein Sly1 [Schizosaccharomyces osmophilus]